MPGRKKNYDDDAMDMEDEEPLPPPEAGRDNSTVIEYKNIPRL